MCYSHQHHRCVPKDPCSLFAKMDAVLNIKTLTYHAESKADPT